MMMKEKGNRKRVHGLSWQLANEKEAVYAEYLTSEDLPGKLPATISPWELPFPA
jgi:hypothetical protein